jgi:O-antigen ligase
VVAKQLLRPTPIKAAAGLVMTDIAYLITLAFAVFLAVDPFVWRLERIALTKHLPFLLALPFVFLTMVGARTPKQAATLPGVLPCFRPLLILALFIVAGSLIARFQFSIPNTFLFSGLYMLAAPMTAYMLTRSSDPVRMLRAYLGLLLVFGFVVFAGLVVNYGAKQVYHELEYLVPPIAVYFVFSSGQRWIRWAGISFFLASAILFNKNTGYLTLVLIYLYLMFFVVWPAWKREDTLRTITKTYTLLLGMFAVAALAAYLLQLLESFLPSGNPEFRMLTYQRAWERFLDSPLWGTGFTAASSEKFTGFDTGVANNVLPTHSDILDVLANGGLLGIMLWLWALVRVGKLAYSSILKPNNRRHPFAAYAHMLACMSLAAIVTYVFNPIFSQPAKSMVLWANLGFLAGISLLVRLENANATKEQS